MDPHTPAPAVDPVADLPAMEDPSQPLGDYSFESALENALTAEPAADPAQPAAADPAQPAAADPAQPEAAPESVLEDLHDTVPEDWTPKAADAFQRLKTELKSARTEREELLQSKKEYELRLKEMEGKVENRDIDTLQERLAEFEKSQMLQDLEKTTAFREAVVEPLDAILNQAKQVAELYGADYDQLVDAMAMADDAAQEERLDELLPNASARDKASIYRMIADIEPIQQRKQELHQNAQEALKEAALVDEQREAAQAAQRAEVRANVTRNVVGRIKEKLPFLSGIEGLDLDAIQEKAAASDPSVINPVTHAYNEASAQLLPVIIREYVAAQKTTEELMAKLSEYADAEPNLSGNPAQADLTGAANGSFADSIERAIGAR